MSSILFITYDRSGYYDNIREELKKNFDSVQYYDTDKMDFMYKNIFQKIYSFFYKTLTKQKYKNFLKLENILKETKKHYDYIVVIRPDFFFDSQLEKLKSRTNNFIAYYQDSINNAPRKKHVIKFFDKVFSYEKKDVEENNLIFLPNFIYTDLARTNVQEEYTAFTVMSKDYRVEALEKLAFFLSQKNIDHQFLVHSKKIENSEFIQYFSKRKNNDEVIEYIKKTKIIVDIHKYGIQDGLTFRVFESLAFEKKLITTNKDIRNYDFFNPNNIHIIEDVENIDIPDSFFETTYEKLPPATYKKYHYKTWLNKILS